MKLLITGGCGFIGSHVVRRALRNPAWSVVNLDALTYAGNPANLRDCENDPRYRFVHGDIRSVEDVERAVGEGVDAIVNLAAETHVDRSILDPEAFLRTDILGTHVLLEAVRRHGIGRYLQVSTDEVYGDVPSGASREDAPIAPRSPYAASKAGGDLQVLAYRETYGSPVLVTRGSNTYGPYQYPEKLISLFCTNLLDGEPVPLYGDGMQIREWLHAEDHASGILTVLERGTPGEIYNIGGGNPRTNREITERLIDACARRWETHVRHVADRPGHDRRYAIDSSKAHAIGWRPSVEFEAGLRATAQWYRENEAWWRPIKSGEFRAYYDRQYAERLEQAQPGKAEQSVR